MKNRLIRPLALSEVARLLAVSPRTVSRLIDKGDLRAVRIGATLAVPLDGMPGELQRCFDVDQPRPLLTLHEVAAELGCSPDDVRALTATGELTPVRIGRSLRCSPTEVKERVRVKEGGHDHRT
ncbi:helix-turn-helix domain-containing protein [Limimaricola sp. G21655-S1]|uniref:helix-turn-helix domain-containing protein n=1 Tax=Limimaricola sp. G21655-S1 TaxID=3014768 RepID=UPI0022AF31DD|nr:helix-turn-helix domain-containing protein [Limimaricola sp. G21655-S1]MCZ4262605.1 helix-turn-helix domain-containing protein [Limimaricola sp. G21655-S1]